MRNPNPAWEERPHTSVRSVFTQRCSFYSGQYGLAGYQLLPFERVWSGKAIVFHMSGRQEQRETLWTFSFSLPFFGAEGSNRLPHGLSNPPLHIPGADLHSSHMLCITCDSGASVLVMLRSYNIKGIAWFSRVWQPHIASINLRKMVFTESNFV